MTKADQFFNVLTGVISKLDTNEVKATIGDSIRNNRVLTVGQVVRYLQSRRNPQLKNLGLSLDNVNDILREEVIESRLNFRTDAIDINELINFYAADVVCLGNNTSLIGRNITL